MAFNGVMAQIQEVTFHSSASSKLSKDGWERAAAWLGCWTPEGNYKSVVAETEQEAVKLLMQQAVASVPNWLSVELGTAAAELFQMGIAVREVKEGQFWPLQRVMVLKWYRLTAD